MMAKKSKIEQLSVVADPLNLELKPAKLKGDHLLQNTCQARVWRHHDVQGSISHRPGRFVYRRCGYPHSDCWFDLDFRNTTEASLVSEVGGRTLQGVGGYCRRA